MSTKYTQIITIEESKTFLIDVPIANNSIIPFFNKSLPNNLSGEIIAVNTSITSAKAHAKIDSLAPIKLPDFTLEDSETDKIYKTLGIEWTSARKQLDLLLTINGTDWKSVASISLLNPSGYPYRVYNLLNLFTENLTIELGDNGMLGVQIINVGYGVLSGNDKLTIYGSFQREIVLQQEIFVPAPTPISTNTEEDEIMALTPLSYSTKNIIIIPGNQDYSEKVKIASSLPTRKYLLIVNQGSTNTILELININFSINLLPRQTFEISRFGLWYTGDIYCYDEANFAIIEGV